MLGRRPRLPVPNPNREGNTGRRGRLRSLRLASKTLHLNLTGFKQAAKETVQRLVLLVLIRVILWIAPFFG